MSVFALVLIILVSTALAQDYAIDKFHSEILISDDSSVLVEETIAVRFHGSRHGIYREIPYKYEDDRGNRITTPLRVLSVTDEAGNNLEFKTARKGNLVNIRIGNPSKYVTGENTYVIKYRVENAVLFFDDHDELYWNVTGNYWWAPIKEASAHIFLESKSRSRNLWAACYTGGPGSKEPACRYETADNAGDFSSARDLGPREGFTIAFGWDKGLVTPPSSWRKFLWTVDITENWIFLFPLFSLVFMIALWKSKGRDPRVKESVAVMYEPPKFNSVPLTPGEVGTLVDEQLDPRDISSTIVGLAVKGYMKIEESKTEGLILDSTDYFLAKLKEPDENLGAFERILMDRIFPKELQLPGRMVSDLKNEFYKNIDLLKKTLYGELVSKNYFMVSPDKVRKVYVAAAFAVVVFSTVVFAWLTSSGKGVLAGILTGLPVFAFAKAMPAKTRAGSAAYTDILGFREFMSRAEKGRLERMKDKDLFSKFLPYAIALDVVDNWAKAFEGIYQEPPGWYSSPTGFRTFHPYSFSRSINAATSSLGSAMFSAPRGSGIGGGSGFSGGGFSGGGFGGGGGGSW
ncbi:MAG TPA: DUF2207 domain-containing protein [Thermodesulfovibrionales bacterium]|nr:DUF2207 domain-containing protein [Thermodesulfovibrionales bacterium]